MAFRQTINIKGIPGVLPQGFKHRTLKNGRTEVKQSIGYGAFRYHDFASPVRAYNWAWKTVKERQQWQ